MRVLAVAPWIPCDVRPRSLGLLNIAASRHQVRLLALTRNDVEEALTQQLPFEVRTVRNRRISSLVRVARALPTRRSLQTGYASTPDLSACLRREIQEYEPDVVHFNVARTAHLVPGLQARAVVDLDELRSDYYLQLSQSDPNPVWRVLGRIEAPRLRELENGLVASQVPLLFSSAADVKTTQSYLVPTPVDTSYWNQVRGTLESKDLLFVGRLHQRANLHAVDWFASKCLPEICRQATDVRMVVTGEKPTKHLGAMSQGAVSVTGYVEDLRSVYQTSRVALVPVHHATGVQMKLLQAMASGVPAVTTTSCAERAGVSHEREVLIADTPSEWIQQVVRLLHDDALWSKIQASALEWVTAVHGIHAVTKALDQAYEAAQGPAD